MTLDFLVNMVVGQVGEEKAKEVLEMILSLSDKMTDEKIYIVKRLGKRGVCLLGTDNKKCKIDFPNGDNPTVTELEKSLRGIEIG